MTVRPGPVRVPARAPALRLGGGLLLLVVAYIHLALMFQVGSFNRLMGALFGLDVLLALVAVGGVLRGACPGWVLGIAAAGGAAIDRLAMDFVPGFSRFLLGFGRSAGFRRFGGPRLHAACPRPWGSGHLPGGAFAPRGSVLPLPLPMGTWATVSIVLEVLFVVLALWALRRLPARA